MVRWRLKILAKLENYVGLKSDVDENFIAVSCDNVESFTVSIHATESQYIVHFDGWHEQFDTEDEALECFAFGLSSQCRLKRVLYGRKPYRWTVQSREGDSWVDNSTVGLLLIPFWRRARTDYRFNVLTRKNVE